MNEQKRTLGWLALTLVCLVLGSTGMARADEPKRPELVLPTGHTKGITSVALSGDGKRAFTGSDDNTARLWDLETGKSLITLKGHTSTVFSVALSEDGKRALTGAKDGTAVLWDLRTSKPVVTLKGHKKGISSVALSKDSKRVLTGSGDKTAVLWDLETSKPLVTLKGHTDSVTSVAMSQDGKRALTGSMDHRAVLWDLETGKPLISFKDYAPWLSSVALSGDGKRAVIGSTDRTAVLWDLETGKSLITLKGHTSKVFSVALSEDGKRALVAALFGTATAVLWDLETGKPLITLKGHTDSVDSVAMSKDGKRALTGSNDKTAVLWDLETGKPLVTLKDSAERTTPMAISGDGKRALIGSDDNTAVLWDLEKVKPLVSLSGHRHLINSAAISGDGKRALTGSADTTAVSWDLETGKPLVSLKGHTGWVISVAMSKDGKRVLTGSLGKPAVLWDLETGKPLVSLKSNTERAMPLAISGDGKRALIGSDDNTAVLWDLENRKSLVSLKGHRHSINSVAFSGDGNCALTGSDDSTAVLWDLETGKRLIVLKGHTSWVTSVALNWDGKRALTGSHDNTAVLWDLETGKPLHTFRLDHPVTCVALPTKGDHFLVASSHGTVNVFRSARSVPLFSFLRVGDEWFCWTPEGYYHSSPNGENLIAWKIQDKKAPLGIRIVGPEQFRERFNRPDLFRHLLTEGDLTKALGKADRERGVKPSALSDIARTLPPEVLIVGSDKDDEITTEQVEIRAVATSRGEHPITRLRLIVDDRPYRGNLSTRIIDNPKLGLVKSSWTVDLDPGKHKIQVVADAASEGRSDILHITRKAAANPLPRLFVLVVGVSDYHKESLRKGVYFCAGDAKRFADTIETSSKKLYREVEVTRLIDKDATRRKILHGLSQVKKKATQRDVTLIFFAGHGARDEENNFFFLPVEADKDELSSTCLSDGDFKREVKGLPGRVVLFLDACHSGTLIENDRRTGEAVTDRLYRDLTSNQYGLIMLCSSRGGQVSKEDNKLKAGYFTLALTEGLSGKAPRTDGAVYLKALDFYVTTRVRELSDGKQHPLTSRVFDDIPLTRP